MERVATFPARQCQGSGRRREKAESRAIGANSGCILKVGIEAEGNNLTHLGVFEASSWVQYVALCGQRGRNPQWLERQCGVHNGPNHLPKMDDLDGI